MVLKIEPFLGLSYNESYKALNWNVWNDENIISCSFYLSATLDGEMGSPPGAMYDGAFTFDGALLYDGTSSDLVDGRTYLVSSPAAGDWVGQEGKLATVVEDGWKFYPPVVGQTMFNTVDESFYLNTGNAFINKDDYGVFPSPSVSCAYPMDASLAEIQALVPSIDAVPVMTDNFQTATYTLTGDAVGGWDLVCVPSLTPPGPITVDFSSGVKAFEWEYSMPVAATPSPNVKRCHVYLGLFYANNFSNGLVHIYIESSVSSNLPVTRLSVDRLGTMVSSVINVPASGMVFVSLDAANGTFSVAHDTLGPIALSDNSYNPLTPCIFSVNMYEAPVTGTSNAGKDIVARLITNASDMTGTYLSGTTSICGDPL